MTDIGANSVLPARREPITLVTSDGLKLVGELALPVDRAPVATILCLHPNPTAEGMMDSHVFAKMAWRLPALADVAVLRWNTRGTSSLAGTSEGHFEQGIGEGKDLAAALAFAQERGLPNIWLVGWSFGTDVTLMHGNVDPVQGAILLSPPLKWSEPSTLAGWAASGRPLVALVPELDEFLTPEEAAVAFSAVPQCEVHAIAGCKHLWIGEKFVRIALAGILKRVRPDLPQPTWEWDGPFRKWDPLNRQLV
jgi:hypothetical protein